MSNSLIQTIPVLDGSNHASWAPQMEAYFKSQGLWAIVSRRRVAPPKPAAPTKEATDEDKAKNKADLAEWEAKFNDWRDEDEKATGILILKITPAIAAAVKGRTAASAWDKLKETYGTPGAAAIFADFKAILNTRISGNVNPAAEIAKIANLLDRLGENNVQIPGLLMSMMLLNALPQKWEDLATIVLQTNALDELTFAEVRNAIMAKWEQVQPAASGKKISAIKRKRHDPNFKQQQQHNNSGESQNKGKKKGHRGKRGGKPKGNDNRDHHHGHTIASSATIDVTGPPAPKAPLFARISEVTPEGIKTREEKVGPAAFFYGRGNCYPKFKKAMTLAKDIGVPRTPQTVRRLEEVVDVPVASSSNVTLDEPDSDNEHASKRARSEEVEEEPLDWGSDLDDEIASAAGFSDDHGRM